MNFKEFLLFVKIKWKAFYYFIIFFIVMTLINAFIVGQSITPFYVYQMYSQSLNKEESYNSFEIEVNGEYFDLYKLGKERQDIISYNFNRYIYLKENNGYDKYFFKLKKIDKYNIIPNSFYQELLTVDIYNKKKNQWLHNLLSFDYEGKINTINIYKTKYCFDSKNNVNLLSKASIDCFVYD